MDTRQAARDGESAGGLRPSSWIALTALSVLFGMQTLRALVPLAVFVLRDRFGWHAAAVGLALLAVLATGFLAAPAWRLVGPRRFLQLTAGGLGLARLALQLWTGDPLGDLGLAAVAAILFFLALPALACAGACARFGRAGTSFVLGWLVGLAADTALHGAYVTWDMSWRSDPATLVTIVVLVGLQWWLLIAAGRTGARDAAGAPRPLAWVWAAFGPLLFLELLVLGNVARLTTLTGWQVEAAALWTLAGRILACGLVGHSGGGQTESCSVARGRPGWRSTAALALALSATFLVSWPRGVVAALLLLAGQALAAMLWSAIVLAAAAGDGRPRRLATSHGVALLAFGVLLFLYYGGIDIRLPFSKDLLPPAAALAFGAAAIVAARSVPARGGARAGYSWLALTILLVPGLIKLVAGPEIRAGEAAGLPLRIMTYNLHLGIDPRGHLGLEHIAATIEAESPDVVTLQEVSRGWILGGSTDALSWLSRRLGMPYVFAPTADPLWGNAVLSRRPILDHQALELPTEDLLIRRGFLAARIGVDAAAPLRGDGDDRPFEIIVTHHHHKRDGGTVRELQSRAILDFWRSAPDGLGRGRTAIVGDFNARPGEPAIEMLRDAGLGDVLDLAGVEPGYTSPAPRPVKRIDYIWISPDLAASEVAVPQAPASDHLPVVATLDLR